MTKRSRGTWHAWHFQFALGLVVKASCGDFCIACLRPLTRRYMHSSTEPQYVVLG
ncbi:TPA: DUF3265 domain-containing protein [Vibrio cholerae]|nr:DUF3265 domain-containing protein [Vibrio cholerae]HDZ9215848.1 DUF3265 domain-containing protein [Vibrio cholerae]